MSTECNTTVISGKFRPRQFEYHPSFPNTLLFGTIRGNICLANLQSGELSFLGCYGLNSLDAILGICWLKNNPYKFVTGSSYGKLICGDMRNKVREHSIDVVEPFIMYNDFQQLTSVHVNSMSSRILVSGYSNDVLLYDVERAEPIQTFSNIHENHINIARFANLSPNLFVTCSFDKTVKAWDQRMTDRQPIYTIQGENGFVMVNFSPDDTFLLTSANDNEINQYLTVDGSRHTSFQLPRTGLKGNFSRAYYSSSGARIVTGACEESGLSVLDSSTGELLTRVDIYPGRKNDSLYIQSLRASPLVEDEYCVLANYKSIRSREIVRVQMKSLTQSKVLVDSARVAVSADHSQMLSDSLPEDKSGGISDNVISPPAAPLLTDPGAASDDLLVALGRQYHTPALTFSLSRLQVSAASCVEHIRLEISSDGTSPVTAFLENSHNPGSVDAVLVARSHSDSGNDEARLESLELYPVHSFILRSRCPILGLRMTALTSSAPVPSADKQLVVVNISDLVPPACVHLMPLLLRYLYEDASVDAEIDRSHAQAAGSSFAGLCLNMVREACLKRLLHQSSAKFRQHSNLEDSDASKEWLHASADDTLWRTDGIASELVNTLEMLLSLAINLDLSHMQQLIVNFLARSTHTHTVFDVLRVAERYGRSDLSQHALSYLAAHIDFLQELEDCRATILGVSNRIDAFRESIDKIVESSRVFIRTESQRANERAFHREPPCTVGRWSNQGFGLHLGYVSEDEEYDTLRNVFEEVRPPRQSAPASASAANQEAATEKNSLFEADIMPPFPDLSGGWPHVPSWAIDPAEDLSHCKFGYLPKMIQHSATRVLGDLILVMGGKDRYTSTPLTNLMFFNTETLTWSHVRAGGRAPSRLINPHTTPLTSGPFSRFVAVVGGFKEEDFPGQEAEGISLLDCATMTWHRPLVSARGVTDGERAQARPWLSRRTRSAFVAYHCPPRFEQGKEGFESADFDRSWILDRSRGDIDRILQENLKSSLVESRLVLSGEVVGTQETWLIVYGGVEADRVKSDLHVIKCSKTLRCVPSSSGALVAAPEILSDWKFESLTPRVGGFRPPFRCDYPAVIVHCTEQSGGDRMLVYGGIGDGNWPMISLRCSDLQNMHWETVAVRGTGPVLRRFNSFTAVKGPAGGVASDVVVLIGGMDEASETSLSDVWVLSIVDASVQAGVTVQWEMISPVSPIPSRSASRLTRSAIKSYFYHRVVEVGGSFFSFGGAHGVGDNHFSYVSILSSPLNRSPGSNALTISEPMSSRKRLTAANSMIRNLSYYGGSNEDKWIWLSFHPDRNEDQLTDPGTFEDAYRLLYRHRLSNTIINGTRQLPLNLAAAQSVLVVPMDPCLGKYSSSLQSDLLRLFNQTQSESTLLLGDFDIEFHVETAIESDAECPPSDDVTRADEDKSPKESSSLPSESGITDAPLVVRAHKELLKRRCEYWRAVFDSSMSESHEKVVRVSVEQPVAFFALIRYLYTDILYIESGDYVSLCELAKQYGMTDLAARCELLACRHAVAREETARELLQYADYLQLRTLWKASASHLLRVRFRDHQSDNAVVAGSVETAEEADGKIDGSLPETVQVSEQGTSSVETPLVLSENPNIHDILTKFLEDVPANTYSFDVRMAKT